MQISIVVTLILKKPNNDDESIVIVPSTITSDVQLKFLPRPETFNKSGKHFNMINYLTQRVEQKTTDFANDSFFTESESDKILPAIMEVKF